MGTGSRLQGDYLRRSLRSCLDSAVDKARANGHAARSTSTFQGVLETCPDHCQGDGPQFGNFEIAYSTRRTTIDAVLAVGAAGVEIGAQAWVALSLAGSRDLGRHLWAVPLVDVPRPPLWA